MPPVDRLRDSAGNSGFGVTDRSTRRVRRLVAARSTRASISWYPCGTTGESPTLTEDERVRVVELVVEEAAGRVPVLAGAGGYDTREVISTARRMKRGRRGHPVRHPVLQQADAGRAVPALQRDRRRASALPMIVYNVPGRTGCNIEAATLVRLARIPNIVGVKEASGNMSQMCEICRAVPTDFIVLSGDDALTLPLMAVGGRGHHLGGLERGARRDGAAWSSWPSAATSPRRARLHDRLLPLMHGQLHRVEPDPGEERDGGDGPARRGLPAADGAAARRVARRGSAQVLETIWALLARTAASHDDAGSRRSQRSSTAGAAGRSRTPRARRSRELRAALSAGERARGRAGSRRRRPAGASTRG